MLIAGVTFSQSGLTDIQGNFYSVKLSDSGEETFSYVSIIDNKYLEVVYVENEVIVLPLIVGFINRDQSKIGINISDLSDSGNLLIKCSVIDYPTKWDCFSTHYGIELLEDFSWNNVPGKPSEYYQKTENLPYKYYLTIHNQENEELLFQEFLNMTVKSICVDQLDIYDDINGEQQGYLVRGDLVEILEEAPPTTALKANEDQWVKVRYLKTDRVYWTYGSCLE